MTFALPFVAAGWLGRELSGLAAFSFTTTMFFLGRVKRDPFSRFCSWQPVAFLGEISYSIYLLQMVHLGWMEAWHGAVHVLWFAPVFTVTVRCRERYHLRHTELLFF